jgi:hypothetical protein
MSDPVHKQEEKNLKASVREDMENESRMALKANRSKSKSAHIASDKVAPLERTAMTHYQRLSEVVHSNAFEIIFLTIIIVNLVPIIIELTSSTDGKCKTPWLEAVNYTFLAVYIIEYILRLVVDKKDYIPGTIWGWIDTFILLIGFVFIVTDIYTHLPVKGTEKCKEAQAGKGTTTADSTGLSFIKVLRVARLVRILKLFRFIIPSNSKFIKNLMDGILNSVYEVTTAMVRSQRDTKKHLLKVPISPHKPLAECVEARTNVNLFLGQKASTDLVADNMGIEVSVKTRQAATEVINAGMKRLEAIYKMGILEDHPYKLLKSQLEQKKLDLKKLPKRLEEPPLPKALHLLPWLESDDDVMQHFLEVDSRIERISLCINLHPNIMLNREWDSCSCM